MALLPSMKLCIRCCLERNVFFFSMWQDLTIKDICISLGKKHKVVTANSSKGLMSREELARHWLDGKIDRKCLCNRILLVSSGSPVGATCPYLMQHLSKGRGQ